VRLLVLGLVERPCTQKLSPREMRPHGRCCCSVAALVACIFVALLWWRRCSRPEQSSRLVGNMQPLAQPRHTGSVIHLPARTDRDRNVRSLLDAARSVGVDLHVHEAADGRSCPDVEVPPFWDYSSPPGHVRKSLRGGEQGCLASFLAVVAVPAAGRGRFILEDDAVVSAEAFRNIARVLSRYETEALAFHGMRAYPRGWPELRGASEREAASEGSVETGWCDVLIPNYSNAMFALTARGADALREWAEELRRSATHRLPADDLLSAAGNAHPGVTMPPMKQHWAHAPRGPLRVLAPMPGLELSTRIISASDTERRTPLKAGLRTDHCSSLL
jgi:hypothetical protein